MLVRQAIVDLALFGTGGVVAESTTVPGGDVYAVDSTPYDVRDVERARALLAEAGLEDGFTVDLYTISTYDFLRDPAEIVQANLAEIGVQGYEHFPNTSYVSLRTTWLDR